MNTDECLARTNRALMESEHRVKALHDAEVATSDLVRKSRAVIAAARQTIAANPSAPVGMGWGLL